MTKRFSFHKKSSGEELQTKPSSAPGQQWWDVMIQNPRYHLVSRHHLSSGEDWGSSLVSAYLHNVWVTLRHWISLFITRFFLNFEHVASIISAILHYICCWSPSCCLLLLCMWQRLLVCASQRKGFFLCGSFFHKSSLVFFLTRFNVHPGHHSISVHVTCTRYNSQPRRWNWHDIFLVINLLINVFILSI